MCLTLDFWSPDDISGMAEARIVTGHGRVTRHIFGFNVRNLISGNGWSRHILCADISSASLEMTDYP